MDFPALPLPFPTRKAKCGDCLEGARIRFLIKICVYIATFAFAFGQENGGNFPHNKSSCPIHSDRVKWQLRQWMVEHRKTTSNCFFSVGRMWESSWKPLLLEASTAIEILFLGFLKVSWLLVWRLPCEHWQHLVIVLCPLSTTEPDPQFGTKCSEA